MQNEIELSANTYQADLARPSGVAGVDVSVNGFTGRIWRRLAELGAANLSELQAAIAAGAIRDLGDAQNISRLSDLMIARARHHAIDIDWQNFGELRRLVSPGRGEITSIGSLSDGNLVIVAENEHHWGELYVIDGQTGDQIRYRLVRDAHSMLVTSDDRIVNVFAGFAESSLCIWDPVSDDVHPTGLTVDAFDKHNVMQDVVVSGDTLLVRHQALGLLSSFNVKTDTKTDVPLVDVVSQHQTATLIGKMDATRFYWYVRDPGYKSVLYVSGGDASIASEHLAHPVVLADNTVLGIDFEDELIRWDPAAGGDVTFVSNATKRMVHIEQIMPFRWDPDMVGIRWGATGVKEATLSVIDMGNPNDRVPVARVDMDFTHVTSTIDGEICFVRGNEVIVYGQGGK